jgi:hypothetical protein
MYVLCTWYGSVHDISVEVEGCASGQEIVSQAGVGDAKLEWCKKEFSSEVAEMIQLL